MDLLRSDSFSVYTPPLPRWHTRRPFTQEPDKSLHKSRFQRQDTEKHGLAAQRLLFDTHTTPPTFSASGLFLLGPHPPLKKAAVAAVRWVHRRSSPITRICTQF